MRTCTSCGQKFVLRPKKPGYINQCYACSSDIPTYFAEQGEGDDGTVETMSKSMFSRTYLEVSREKHWSVDNSAGKKYTQQ